MNKEIKQLLLFSLYIPVFIFIGKVLQELVSLPSFTSILLLFYISDIYGLDGGLVYVFSRILGTKADFIDHLYFITLWKPLLLLVTIPIVIVLRNIYLYLPLNLLELLFFYLTFRIVHKFSKRLSVAFSLVIFFVSLFLVIFIYEII